MTIQVNFQHRLTPQELPKLHEPPKPFSPRSLPPAPQSERPIPIKERDEKPNFDPVRDDPELLKHAPHHQLNENC